MEDENIVEIAVGSADFNILVQALTTADLVTTIQNATDITVFAPTDAAFTALAVDLGFDGDQTDETAVFNFIAGALTDLGGGDPIPLLTQILTYHVSPGAKDSAAVTALTDIATLEGTTITRDGLVLQDQEPDIADPTLETLDINASNGIIHSIDRVLLPIDIPGNTNLVDIALGSDDFNILVQALSTAGLVDTIRNSDDITIFAPTDAAFGRLATDLGFDGDPADETAVFNFIATTLTSLGGGDPVPLLTQILTYHVSPGAKDSAAVLATDTIGTLEGTEITRDGLVLVDQEPDVINPALDVAGLDIGGANGIIHTIDHVLLPLDIESVAAPSLVEIALGDASGPDGNPDDTDLLAGALAAAGLVEAVSGADLTVLAPTDAAFVALANDLGFAGSDEAGALNFIVGALTGLGGGDPIPLLTAILTYHVAPGQQQLANIAAAGEITTLQGSTITVDGTTLVDGEPDLTDPSLVATDIQASDGIVHLIDRVLVPVDIPTSNGANAVQISLGTDARDRLEGGIDNDLLIGAGGPDIMIGGAGSDTFVLSAGSRSKIIDFEAADLLDVTAWNVGAFEDLTVFQRSAESLLVFAGGDSVVLQAASGPLDAGSLTGDSFVFGEVVGETLTGTADRDRLEGGAGDDTFDGLEGLDIYIGGGGADTFILGTDIADKVIDFTDGEDLLDVSAFGAADLAGLELIQRSDASFYIRVGTSVAVIQSEQNIDVTALTADDFIFT